MFFDNSSSLAVSSTHLSESEEENFIHIHQFISPKFVFVDDICSEQLRGDTTCQIF